MIDYIVRSWPWRLACCCLLVVLWFGWGVLDRKGRDAWLAHIEDQLRDA